MLAPIIVLGLGGVGSEIVAKLERKVKKKKLDSPMLFATLDTDINTINRIQKEGFEGCQVQISKNMTVKEYLKEYEQAKEWFSTTEGLNIKSMTEGAGQVRAISRLAFEVAVKNDSLSGLEGRIRHLFQISNEGGQQAPRILIVSSLAGGTGSGILLPIALYLRRYFQQALHISTVIIKGMFIMPDVFEDIIGSNFEQASIQANAYAAIKELEAFMKKGDGYLEPEFQSKLYLQLPSSGSEELEEYHTLPYNYCYLFGRKNVEGKGLRNFQDYLDYTVECIYAQAFSPMQELNNSIEDNVFRITTAGIRECGKEGFKRFCSAGISVLEYPYEDIVRILALRKGSRALTEQWSMIDKEYFNECKRMEELREKGIRVKNQSKRDFYIEYVESEKKNNIFIGKVYQDTVYDEKRNESNNSEKYGSEEPSWKLYWSNIEKAVSDWLLTNHTLKESEEDILQFLESGREFYYHRGRDEIIMLQNLYEDFLENMNEELNKKRSIAGTKFFGKRVEEEKKDKAYFEYWLQKDGNYIHPNAVRYFLYHSIKLFQDKKEYFRKEISEQKTQLEQSRNSMLDRHHFYSNAFLNNFLNKSEIMAIYNRIGNGMEIIKQYQQSILLEHIAAKGCEFFERLSEEYEHFYEVFEYNVQQYMERAEDIQQRLWDTDGTIKKYVCCNQTCLDKMGIATFDTRNDVEIAGEISKVIFNSIFEKVMQGDHKENYHIVFQKVLIQHWEEELKSKYKHVLNMDILNAIEQEGMYLSQSGIRGRAYIETQMERMWGVASPFIRVNNENAGLNKVFCSYSFLLENEKDHIRNQIIQILKNNGGTVDVEGAIDQYTIIFYKVLYGLAPYDLKDMSIVKEENADKFEMGNMSRFYYQMLENVRYSQITPHIDWNWNCFNVLPDFNYEYQLYLENIVYQIFIYKCVVDLKEVQDIGEEQSRKKKYTMTIGDRNVYEDVLREILFKYFIKDLSAVKKIYAELKKEIQKNIQKGRKEESLVFFKEGQLQKRKKILEVIYCVCAEGEVQEEYDVLSRKLVYAWIDLLWFILTQFHRKEEALDKLASICHREVKDFNLNHEPSRLYNDIVSALRDKMREMERKIL